MRSRHVAAAAAQQPEQPEQQEYEEFEEDEEFEEGEYEEGEFEQGECWHSKRSAKVQHSGLAAVTMTHNRRPLKQQEPAVMML